MNKKKTAPELRFKGFTDDWEQRKLSEITDSIGTGKSSFINHKKSSDNPYAILGSTSIIGYDSEFDYEGDFILTARVGANAGRLYRYYGKAKITDNTVFMRGENLSFLYPLLEKIDLKKLSFGTGQPLVKASELKNLQLKYPSSKEQSLIGNFFSQFDDLINLYQQKLGKLQEIKRAYLDLIFNQKVRFKGFSGEWEQRSLSKVGNFVKTSVDPQATPDELFVEYSMPSYDNGRNPETVLGDSMESLRLKISGDVLLINKLNVRQKRIWLVEDAPCNAVASSEFMPFTSTEIDLVFLEQLMLSDKTTRDLESISSGTSNSQKRITPSDVLKFLINLPVDRTEQEEIGSFFKNIDYLNALYQHKIEKLNKLKQGFLQKMFI